jgi:hypothetical protein
VTLDRQILQGVVKKVVREACRITMLTQVKGALTLH